MTGIHGDPYFAQIAAQSRSPENRMLAGHSHDGGGALVDALRMMETAMNFARYREAVLSSDVANVNSGGFVPKDVALAPRATPGGVQFAAALREMSGNGPGSIERAMGAIAKNAVWYRALTQQARAILREYRTVAEEARR
jgi:flagellar basal body rod protein FlgB